MTAPDPSGDATILPKIAVMASIKNFDRSYSIAGVVMEQLQQLSARGLEVLLLTSDDFTDFDAVPKGVTVATYEQLPSVDPKIPASVDACRRYSERVAAQISEALTGCSYCLTHDLVFLFDFAPINWGIRGAIPRLPRLRWLHWIHSAPGPRRTDLAYPLDACYSGLPNSTIVAVNRSDVPQIARMFDVPEAFVRTVHNWVDPKTRFDMHPLSAHIYDLMDFFCAEFVCVYPTRLAPAKQIDKLIKLMGALHRGHGEARLVVCSSFCNGPREREYIDELNALAWSVGLSRREFMVTSDRVDLNGAFGGFDLAMGVPPKVVTDLLALCDLFVLPSVSEACSLTMLEAGLSKATPVLNRDVFSMLEFLGQEIEPESHQRGHGFSFGSMTRPIGSYSPSEEAWYADRARSIVDFQAMDTSISFFKYVRKEHSPRWILDNQLLPLLGLGRPVQPESPPRAEANGP